MSVNTPIVNAGLLYVNNLQLTNDATTPNTKLDIAVGQARDSTNVNDITLSTAVVINGLTFGVANGVDIAALVASSFYAVFVIGDSNDVKTTAGLLSLSATAPALPVGYDMFRRIGYVLTDSSAHILKFWQYGSGAGRRMYYDTPIATPAITTATTYSSQSLAAGIPAMACDTILKVTFTPNTATDIVQMAPYGSSPTTAMIAFGYGSDAAVAQVGMATVPCALNSSVPTITHKETSASDALVIAVSGYVDNL